MNLISGKIVFNNLKKEFVLKKIYKSRCGIYIYFYFIFSIYIKLFILRVVILSGVLKFY